MNAYYFPEELYKAFFENSSAGVIKKDLQPFKGGGGVVLLNIT